MMNETSVSDMLADGIAAARAGETAEAQRLLRRVTELEPGNVTAWIWRADMAETNADKKSFLEAALGIDPSNAEAQQALARLNRIEGGLAARAEDAPLFCTVHPDRETMLRCNRCGRPMCTECAVRHPVGLRCRECVQETKSPIYKVGTGTTARAFLAATFISTVIGALVLAFGPLVLGFGFFGLLIGFFVGGALGRAIAAFVQRVVPRKRGRPLQGATAAGIILGLLLAAAGFGIALGGLTAALPAAIQSLIQLPSLLYLGTAIAAAVAALR
jgi:hypothetical protein